MAHCDAETEVTISSGTIVLLSLGLRLVWLFDNDILPVSLRDLSTCIKDDGNDGAHEGILGEEDAADILDFTYILLERLFTEPKRLEIAQERHAARRQ